MNNNTIIDDNNAFLKISNVKTIFYRECEVADADYWFHDVPYKEWFTLNNVLYETNSSIQKCIENEDNSIATVIIASVRDIFIDNGLIRRVVLFINN